MLSNILNIVLVSLSGQELQEFFWGTLMVSQTSQKKAVKYSKIGEKDIKLQEILLNALNIA